MHIRPPHAGDGATDPLLPEAIAWIAQLRSEGVDTLPYPISRLQRQLRIGYNRTVALLEALMQRGELSLEFGANGTRHARILPGTIS